MKFVDFITKVIFGNYNSEGYYKADEQNSKDSYALTSIFPSATIEKKVLGL